MSERLTMIVYCVGSTPILDSGLILRFDDERERMAFSDGVDRGLTLPRLVTTANGGQFFMRPAAVIAYSFPD